MMTARTLTARALRLAGAGIGLLVMIESVSAAPEVKLTETSFSWGKVQQHAVLTKRFWIKSIVNKPVTITEATPDCGCTTILLRDSLVKPGDSVPMDIILHSRYFVGYTEKRPYILTKGVEEKVVLKLYADVMPKPETASPLTMSPTRVDVSQYSEKPRRKATFTLTNTTGREYTIKVVDSTAKDFDIVLPPKIGPNATVEGQIIVHKDAVPKSFEESVTFELNDDFQSRYSVPVWRQYQGPGAAPAAPPSGE